MNNSLAEVHPELVSEWSEKNLPLTPDSITSGSNKIVGKSKTAQTEKLSADFLPRAFLFSCFCGCQKNPFCSFICSCTFCTSTDFTGVIVSQATDAATPAACPVAQHIGMMRMDACASWSQEMHLPATKRLSASFTIRLPSGMV